MFGPARFGAAGLQNVRVSVIRSSRAQGFLAKMFGFRASCIGNTNICSVLAAAASWAFGLRGRVNTNNCSMNLAAAARARSFWPGLNTNNCSLSWLASQQHAAIRTFFQAAPCSTVKFMTQKNKLFSCLCENYCLYYIL